MTNGKANEEEKERRGIGHTNTRGITLQPRRSFSFYISDIVIPSKEGICFNLAVSSFPRKREPFSI
jgi:hypothetical protein